LSIGTKRLIIIVAAPRLILSPSGYCASLFSATRCFIQEDILPSPEQLDNDNFAVIGIMGPDYFVYNKLHEAMCKLACPQPNEVSGYPILWECSLKFILNTNPQAAPLVRMKIGLRSEDAPRKAVDKRNFRKVARRQRSVLFQPSLGPPPQLPPRRDSPDVLASGLVIPESHAARPARHPLESILPEAPSFTPVSHDAVEVELNSDADLPEIADLLLQTDDSVADIPPVVAVTDRNVEAVEVKLTSNADLPEIADVFLQTGDSEVDMPPVLVVAGWRGPHRTLHNDDTLQADLASGGPLPPILTVPSSPPDHRFHYIQNERFRDLLRMVPFHLAEPLNKVKNLRDLIAKLMLGRQKGRITRFCELWQKEPLEQLTPDAKPGYQYFRVSFVGIMFQGIRLVCVPPEKAEGGKKMCVLGCEKNGNHCWISNSGYHLAPLMADLE
jgi:hypothetical protein